MHAYTYTEAIIKDTTLHAIISIAIRTFLGDYWPSVVEVLSKSDIFTQVAIFVSKLHARCRSRIAKICVLVSPNFRSKTLFRLSCITFYYFFSRLWLCSDCSAVVSPYHSRRNLWGRTGRGCVRGRGVGRPALCVHALLTKRRLITI